MDSNYIKACLCAYFRFSKRCFHISTEVGRFNCDFLAISGETSFEVEIKTSKEDLNADFRKAKHRIYEMKCDQWTPNYFYFCVPPELLDHAIAKCAGTKYGVMKAYSEDDKSKSKYMFKERISVVKKAVKLHNNLVSDHLRKTVLARQSSEMANLRIKTVQKNLQGVLHDFSK